MTTIQRIENEVSRLSMNELAVFRAWFDKFDAKVWDKQFADDVKSGKLNNLAHKAIDEYKAGKCKKL